jgi:abequosyltransferase
MDEEILLSIAIPTYNRAIYLDRCLHFLSRQELGKYNIEVIIFDNASTDHTTQIINEHLQTGVPILYYRNEENIGPDKNIANCYLKAKGKYVLVLGDDDVLLPDAIKIICKILTSGNYGVIYLNFFGFVNDEKLKDQPVSFFDNIYLYNNADILSIMRSNISFTSSNIINRTYINEKNINATMGTNLNQIPGVINAIFSSDQNVYVGKYLLAQQMNNSGGYNYMNVFGTNFINVTNTYIKQYVKKNNMQKKYCNWIFQDLIISLYPQALFRIRNEQGNEEALSNYRILRELLARDFKLKLFVFPIVQLPAIFTKYFLFLTKIPRKFLYYYYKMPFRGKKIKFDK